MGRPGLKKKIALFCFCLMFILSSTVYYFFFDFEKENNLININLDIVQLDPENNFECLYVNYQPLKELAFCV
ncbi:MAG: hypothetical protein QF682_13610 [Candidatus Thermoplasmatota archaeon]|jgi:hypothetical protein|nr:hypothetical protein [Candidatus Thermoplasmatota archaeon]